MASVKEKSALLEKSISELAKKVVILDAENTQFAIDLIDSRSLMDDLSAKKTLLLVKLKSEMLRLGISREKYVQRERRTA